KDNPNNPTFYWVSLRQLHGLQACYNIGAGKCQSLFPAKEKPRAQPGADVSSFGCTNPTRLQATCQLGTGSRDKLPFASEQ
uniref:Uncharacterized protein n=1 Tax=Geospiza parvula TaxID=87175 RepID=A0A8U8C0G3_GEOPR